MGSPENPDVVLEIALTSGEQQFNFTKWNDLHFHPLGLEQMRHKQLALIVDPFVLEEHKDKLTVHNSP